MASRLDRLGCEARQRIVDEELQRFLPEIMEFTLTYRGALPSAEAKSHSDVQWRIRRHFHEQLKTQWRYEITLRRYRQNQFRFPPHDDPDRLAYCEYRHGPFAFVPLVIHAPAMQFVCHLDIELLRRDTPGEIFAGGDLDNRIKVLFDALRVPDRNQIKREKPGPDETPFFVLLEDDKLITEFSIVSKHLLRPPAPTRPPLLAEQEKDVELNIRVAVEIGEQSPYQGKGRI
jgi:hypothetical protein